MPEEPKPQDGQQQTSTQPNTTPTDPPINNQPSASNNDRELASLYEQVLRDKEEENKRLRAEIEAEKSNRNATPPLTPDEQKAKFFNEPFAATREIVQKEIRDAVAPLIEFTSSFRQQSQYDQLKNRYRNDPRFATVFPQIEKVVDQMMANAEKNDATMQTAIFSAMGMLSAGMIPNAAPRPTTTTPANNGGGNVTPPHMHSTPPAMPQDTQKSKTRELNENEKRLARARGMSDEQYLAWLNMPASSVAVAEVK